MAVCTVPSSFCYYFLVFAQFWVVLAQQGVCLVAEPKAGMLQKGFGSVTAVGRQKRRAVWVNAGLGLFGLAPQGLDETSRGKGGFWSRFPC